MYFVRVRAINAEGAGPVSNEVQITVESGVCAAAPSPPQLGPAVVLGSMVTFAWTSAASGCAATNYTLHAGTAPALANIAAVNTGVATSFATIAPSGTYYVRVTGGNSYGTSAASNEVQVVVGGSGGCAVPPDAPLLAVPNVSGNQVTFAWTAAAWGSRQRLLLFKRLSAVARQHCRGQRRRHDEFCRKRAGRDLLCARGRQQCSRRKRTLERDAGGHCRPAIMEHERDQQ